MKDVANCPRCGKIFVKALRPICQHCSREQEDNFDKVSKFMRTRQNRMATLRQVHEETKVPLEQIHQFIREKRILVSQFPNLGYPCESCGTIIQEGRVCESCKDNITSGLEQLEKEKDFAERRAAAEQAEKKRSVGTYHSLNDRISKK
ncbi:TIGR03826 family flagellar region protein [Halalkalibacter nanhaiisediminis]|uniref:Flagellar operon protein (TIGR03826 family) n=1 Tax=Halalkalibacter nanhaiisediminis TaxID=688079 RepID=A0A562QTK7_9BACI|nr:TIGR03826 family flagellar region protein [Halalkalibacter nanhaiisediminis]TWI59943.1 flagellar operon protein (TIGR03826 family) [Halalkalibacter nanhaiisediminis]